MELGARHKTVYRLKLSDRVIPDFVYEERIWKGHKHFGRKQEESQFMTKMEGKRLGKFILEVGRKQERNGSQRWEFRRKGF